MIKYLALLLLPIAFRLRGGLIHTGSTQAARLLFWVLPVGLISWNPYCAVGAFLGLMIPHGKWFAAGDAKSNIGMAVIGFLRMGLIIAPLAYYNPMVAFVSFIGLLSGLANWACWTWLHGKDIGIAENGAEWRELIDGLIYGIGLGVGLVLMG